MTPMNCVLCAVWNAECPAGVDDVSPIISANDAHFNQCTYNANALYM